MNILALFKVALLGMDIVSALVTRLQERFKTQIATGEHFSTIIIIILLIII